MLDCAKLWVAGQIGMSVSLNVFMEILLWKFQPNATHIIWFYMNENINKENKRKGSVTFNASHNIYNNHRYLNNLMIFAETFATLHIFND